jgi:hypothetical protein
VVFHKLGPKAAQIERKNKMKRTSTHLWPFKTSTLLLGCCILATIAATPIQLFADAHWDVSIQTTAWYNTGRSLVGPYVAGDGVLYAGARYEATGGAVNMEVWRWTKCDGWLRLGTLTRPDVATITALHLAGDVLYVAGWFTDVSGVGATNVAKCDLNCHTWSPVGDGTLDNVWSLTVDANGKVYVGAGETSDNGASYHSLLYSLDGSSWATVGGGMWGSALQYPLPNITALAADGTNIYVGGAFAAGRNSNGTRIDSPNLIKWTGSQWQAMGGGSGLAILTVLSSPEVQKIVVSGTNVFVAGDFSNAGDPPVGLDRFSTDGSHVHAYTLYLDGYASGVGSDLSVQGKTVYLAGRFDHIDSDSVEAFAQCTEGGTWTSLGTGVSDSDPDTLQGWDVAVAPYSNSIGDSVFILGQYDHAGGDVVESGYPLRWVSTAEDTDCSIPTNSLVLWVQARTNDVDIDINGNVTTWYDQSGRGNNLTPYSSDYYTPSASGPAWVDDDGAGYPAVGFTPGTMMYAPYAVTNSDWTVLAVASETGDHYYNWVAALARILEDESNDESWASILLTDDQFGNESAPSPQAISLHGGLTFGPAFSPGFGISYNTTYTFTSKIKANGDMTFAVNGLCPGTASTGCTNSLSGMNTILIGGVDGWSDLIGPIREVLMYNRTLTTNETSHVESYLKQKWGIP